MTKLQASLDTIDGLSDRRLFVESAKRPDLTHCQSAALSLLHDPNNRGALVGVALSSSSSERNHQASLSPRSAGAALELRPVGVSQSPSNAALGMGAGMDASLSTDLLRNDMERIVVALFATSARDKASAEASFRHSGSLDSMGSMSSSSSSSNPGLAATAASLGALKLSSGRSAAADAHAAHDDDDSQHPLNPLHPLSPSSSGSNSGFLSPLAPPSPVSSSDPQSPATSSSQPPVSLITANERRRMLAMLDTDAGRQALVKGGALVRRTRSI